MAEHRRLSIVLVLMVVALGSYPWAVGGLAARLFASRASARLGRAVTVERGRAGLGEIILEGIVVAGAERTAGQAPSPALVSVARIVVPFGVAFGSKGPIAVSGVRAHVVRGGADDNVTSIIDRLRKPGGGGAAPAAGATSHATPPGVVVEDAALDVRDEASGVSLSVAALDGRIVPGERMNVRLGKVRGLLALAGDDRGPRFGAEEVGVQAPLEGLRPAVFPAVRVQGGYATPLPTLSLTGITGVIAPPPDGVPDARRGLIIDLQGSYGGARQTLWTAKGRADPDRREGKLALRAKQFSLDKIADVLPRSVRSPERTKLDAAFDLDWAGDAVRFGGELAVGGLTLQHDGLAAEPVENVSVGLAVSGTAYPRARKLEIKGLEARVHNVTARLSGTIELPPGTYRFANGSKLAFVPKIDLGLAVPPIPCAKLLASIPAALTPKLTGFVLKGVFQAAVAAKIDFSNLDALDLRAKVGIDGCKVLKAPEAVTALAGPGSIVVNVEVPPAPPRPGAPRVAPPPRAGAVPEAPELMPVVIGPDNPDFAPYDQISPYLVASIMTTEDNGFFKHRGWVTSEFKAALKRNLERGGFRLGASSITMQMVKNVLLSQEKTLSRKLQELFLVWYLEQQLPKERILELYFNAIEFGPRIYGIGAATRHYFGKRPADLTPLEATFFSSILPSPKRRYIQYCHGGLFPPWEKYVRRILAKVHERGRITDDEYAAWATQHLAFDRQEATFTERQCLEWIKSITARPEPEAPPDLDDDTPGDNDVAAASPKKVRRLLVRGDKRGTAAAAARAKAAARTQ